MAQQKESVIQRDIRLKLGQLDDLVLWRNETGAYAAGCTVNDLNEVRDMLLQGSLHAAQSRLESFTKRAQWVSYGLCKGSADLIGIIKPIGRFFALELKTLKGKLTEEQQLFINLVNAMGGYAGVARSVEQALYHYHRAAIGLASEAL